MLGMDWNRIENVVKYCLIIVIGISPSVSIVLETLTDGEYGGWIVPRDILFGDIILFVIAACGLLFAFAGLTSITQNNNIEEEQGLY